MITIKNSKELKKYTDKNKDLFLKDEDVHIEFQPTKEELRDVHCRDLFLMNDDKRFDFTGRDFIGWDFTGGNFTGRDFIGWDFTGRNFTGRNFTGWNFTGRDFTGGNFTGGNFIGRKFTGGNFTGGNFTGRNFTGWDFIGRDFIGRNFTGKKVSYWAFFNCYESIKCTSIEGRREPHAEPVCLEGKLEIISESKGKKVKIKLSNDQIVEGEIVED